MDWGPTQMLLGQPLASRLSAARRRGSRRARAIRQTKSRTRWRHPTVRGSKIPSRSQSNRIKKIVNSSGQRKSANTVDRGFATHRTGVRVDQRPLPTQQGGNVHVGPIDRCCTCARLLTSPPFAQSGALAGAGGNEPSGVSGSLSGTSETTKSGTSGRSNLWRVCDQSSLPVTVATPENPIFSGTGSSALATTASSRRNGGIARNPSLATAATGTSAGARAQAQL